MPADSAEKPAASDPAKNNTKTDGKNVSASDTESEAALSALLAQIEEKLSAFESEGLEELFDQLALSRHNGILLESLADEFDFLGASEVLERMDK